MTDITFQPAEPDDTAPDPDELGCQCPPGDNQYLLELDEGQAVLVHATCGKSPSYAWGDFQEFVVMNPIPVTVDWESDCDGNRWHGLNPCDCDSWVRVTASSVPEDVRTQALELSRKHAAGEQLDLPSPAETAPADESPHVYMDAVQDSAAWAYALTKAGQIPEALEHVEAMERLLAAYRRAVGA